MSFWRPAAALLLLQLLLWGQSAPVVIQSPERLVQQGANLTQAAAQEMEAQLEVNPEDLTARTKLLGYYYYQWMRPGEAVAKAARRRHILWLIEHHPEAPVTGLSEASIDETGNTMADAEGYAQAKRLWLAQMNSGTMSPLALGNMGRFFQMADKELAEKAFLQAHAMQPRNYEWDWRLGYLYGMGVLGVDNLGLNGQPTSVDPLLQKTPFAERSRKALAESKSGVMLEVAASILWRYGTMLTPSEAHKVEIMDEAIKLMEQAKAAEPTNPNWQLVLLRLQAYKRQLQAGPKLDR